jgi:hypothetical protein
MLDRLLPRRPDSGFEGHPFALWLLWLLLGLMMIVSLRSIFDTAAVASGPDGLPLATVGASARQTILMLFALDSVGELTIALIGVVALLRYKALVPMIYLFLIGEQVGRRLVIQAHLVPRAEGSLSGWYLVFAILGSLSLGFILSLLPLRAKSRP